MRDPHHIIETCLTLLGDIATNGMPCRTNNGGGVLLHSMLTSYVANILKTEDLLGLKSGSKTLALWYLRAARQDRFPLSTNAELQTPSSTKNILEKHGNASTKFEMESILYELSMLSVSPVHHTFPMLEAHPSVDIYAAIRVQPMQCYLWVSVDF